MAPEHGADAEHDDDAEPGPYQVHILPCRILPFRPFRTEVPVRAEATSTFE